MANYTLPYTGEEVKGLLAKIDEQEKKIEEQETEISTLRDSISQTQNTLSRRAGIYSTTTYTKAILSFKNTSSHNNALVVYDGNGSGGVILLSRDATTYLAGRTNVVSWNSDYKTATITMVPWSNFIIINTDNNNDISVSFSN